MKLVPVAAAILLVSTSSAHAQWLWSYPTPQGHELYDVVFLDNDTAIAIGEFGTIMVTHDTGTTWSVSAKVQSVTTDLSRIEKLDDNTALVVGKNGIVLRTTNQGATWALAPASTSNDLLDVSFADALHGVIAAGNQVLRTSNGGLSWQVTPFVSGAVMSIDMISATEVMCVTPLFRSTDGGASWSAVTMPAGASGAGQVDFLDSLHGAVGRGAVAGSPLVPARCYVTSDGGATWTSSLLTPNDTSVNVISKLTYPASNRIAVVGRINWASSPSSGFMSRSTTGGASFASVLHAWPLNGMAENSSGVALIVGWGGKIMRQNTAGSTFSVGGPHQDPTTFGVSGVSFVNPQVGVVFGSEGEHVVGGTTYTSIAYTSNGGNTWARTWVAGQLTDVVGLSSTEFIGVGMDVSGTKGIVARSTNGGATWSLIWSQSVPSRLRAVATPLPWFPAHVVAVGNSGTVLHITNGVVTPVATGGTDFDDIAFYDDSTLVAVGATDMRSYDSGQTWETTSNSANQTIDITAITFLPHKVSTVLFGIAADGIYQSWESSGQLKIGDFWARDLSATGLRDIQFDPTAQYVVAVGSTVLVNSSQTRWRWRSIEKPTPYPLHRVSVPISGLSFMSGPQAITFRHQYQTPVPTLIRSLNANARNFGVDLRWEVTTDDNLSGFTITRSMGTVRHTIASDLAVTSRTFRDESLAPGATYEYQLIAVDQDGSYTQSMLVTVTIPTAVLELLPNQPNPFNPETTIRFVVPERTQVILTVHDVRGRLAATLMEGRMEPGMRVLTWRADGMASGVYFVRLRAGKAETSRKMLLLK